jgi:hypothetical protein
MLRAAWGDLASETIAKAAVDGDPVISARLIRSFPVTCPPSQVLREFVRKRPPSDDTLAAWSFEFDEFRYPTDRSVIRRHLSDPAWHLRVQAATALGQLGTQEDEAELLALFNDEECLVRYRAGEALASLGSMTKEELLEPFLEGGTSYDV